MTRAKRSEPQIEHRFALPMVDGAVLPVDPSWLQLNLGTDPALGIALMYRAALVGLMVGDEKIRKEWFDEDGQPKPPLLKACAEVRLRFRTKNVEALRRRVVTVAEGYEKGIPERTVARTIWKMGRPAAE